jgi:hypothetical protein
MKDNRSKCCCIHRIVLEKLKHKTWLLVILAKVVCFFSVLASDYWR